MLARALIATSTQQWEREMGDNKISEAAVEAGALALSKYCRGSEVVWEEDRSSFREALAAALPHLQGEAVPVACLPGYVRSAISGLAHIAMKDAPQVAKLHVGVIDNWLNSTHPQPAELSEVPQDLVEAIAAGNGTLHGAIAHWQDRALAAEAKLSEVPGDSGELGEEYAGDTLNKLRVLLGHMCDSSVFQPPNDYNLGFDAGCRMAREQAALASRQPEVK